MPKTILIIDDEKTIRWSLAEAIAATGYETVDAETAADGIAKFREASPDLVLLDMKLPDGSGLDVLRMVKSEDPTVPVVMMTAYAEVETAVEAMKLGAYDFVAKPYSVDKLRVTISNALENQRLKNEIAYLRSSTTGNAFFKQFIGRSPAMVEIFDKIKKIAPQQGQHDSHHGRERFRQGIGGARDSRLQLRRPASVHGDQLCVGAGDAARE